MYNDFHFDREWQTQVFVKYAKIFIAIGMMLSWMHKLGYLLALQYYGATNEEWVIAMGFAAGRLWIIIFLSKS